MFMYFYKKKYMKKLILSAAVLAMVFVGCKKEETKPSDSSTSSSTSASTPRISKETIYRYYNDSFNDSIISDTSITLYTYDSKGRLVSQINDYSTSTYSYISANLISVTTNDKYDGSVQNNNNSYNYVLDSKGIATKYYTDLSKDTILLYYSPEGFSLGTNLNYDIEVKDGNVVNRLKIAFEYYLDKNNTIGSANKGVSFFGKDSKNLVKSERWVAVGSNPMSSSSEYLYEFDSKNRVIKSTRKTVTTNGLSGAGKIITKYEYIN